MSRVAWLDCSVAAAGDMLLAALLDAGASLERVRSGLRALDLDDWQLETEEVHRGAFRATRARVTVRGAEEAGGPAEHEHGHQHEHHHEHEHHHAHEHHHEHEHHHTHEHEHHHEHGGTHEHEHHHEHGHPHEHGSWRAIRGRIGSAPLPERVRQRALAAYARLAEAEAKLHGMPVDDVVLHEVGSTDAVIDMVGVCLALEDLGVDAIVATPLPMGTGRVHAAHGALPLPAPATIEVLRGWPVVPSAWPGEWVTPTGAALVAALATPGPLPAMVPTVVGYGAGRRDPPQVANLVRVVIGEVHGAATDEVVELACNLDDTTGELVAPVLQLLLDEGALDVWALPATMKKGRPGLVLHALARPADADRLGELLLRHTSTLGVRRAPARRQVLDRWHATAQTPYGPVRIKVGGRDGLPWHGAPEFEDVQARAREAGVPVQEVWRAALAGWDPSVR